jgi:hypothetical protein
LEGLFLQHKHMEITKRSTRSPYEAPEAEELKLSLETAILSEQLAPGEEDDYDEF